MDEALLWLGRLTGFIGAVVCAAALALRFTGQYTIGGFEIATLFLGGTSAMVFACFCLLLRKDRNE
jgi:hypothetical protein